jgi:hypothetical protein
MLQPLSPAADLDLRSVAFDTHCQRALLVTAGVGTLIAVAHAVPGAVRSVAIVAGLAVWTAACASVAAALVQLAVRTVRVPADRGAALIGLAGIATAALSAIQLELIRLAGRPALIWNIDWRYHLNLAQAIARTGGVDAALDYAGAPVSYQVGPAWFAGAVERTLGGGIGFVSFGLVPLLCVLMVATGAVQLLRACRVPLAPALAAAGVSMTLPMAGSSPRGVYWGLPGNLLDDRYWPFSAGLMLNSYFGLAVGLASLSLLLSHRARSLTLAMGSVGLASVVALKPPFFVAFALFCGIAALGRLLGLVPGDSRSGAAHVLAAAGASLLGAVALLMTLPHALAVLGGPSWTPWRTAYRFAEYNRNSTVLLVLAVAVAGLVRARWRGASAQPLTLSLLVCAAVALGITSLTLSVVSFPVDPTGIAQAQRLGATNATIATLLPDIGQISEGLRRLLVLLALAVLAERAPALSRSWGRIACAGAVLVVLSPLGFVAREFVDPLTGHEAAEDADLLAVLRRLPDRTRPSIASDLADPAEDYARPLRAPLLTAYGGDPFYVANLVYVHFRRADAVERMQALGAFFGSPWSPWHSRWLAQTGIGAVLVSGRCPPVWLGQAEVPLQVLAQQGRWTAYLVRPADTGPSSDGMPARWQEIHARYGQAPCLAWNRQ